MSTPTQSLPPVGQVVDRIRRESGWTVTGLARHLGVSRQAVQAWQRGTYPPGRDHARRIAIACGKNPGYLLQYANWEIDLAEGDETVRYLWPAAETAGLAAAA